jgi:hypothetical protein
MRIVFFVSEDFSSCLDYLEERRRVKPMNLVLHLVRNRGFELVVVQVEDDVSYDRLMRFLYDCGVDYVYEMEGGVPRILKYVGTRLGGTTVVEAKFV